MKKSLLLYAFLFCLFTANAQQVNQEPIRFIEVTGSSEIEIEPDEIVFIIRIKEFWKEEFEKKAKEEDYKTKVPIAIIESELLSGLESVGVGHESITVQEIGNFQRERGKDFLISKQLEIKLNNFKTIIEIVNTLHTNGIDYMGIGSLKNKNIAKYREQGKIMALKAAKDKAEYLLASLGEQLGPVMTITEPGDEAFFHGQAQYKLANVSNAMYDSGSIDNIRKIKLRYEMTVKFGIK